MQVNDSINVLLPDSAMLNNPDVSYEGVSGLICKGGCFVIVRTYFRTHGRN